MRIFGVENIFCTILDKKNRIYTKITPKDILKMTDVIVTAVKEIYFTAAAHFLLL